MRLRFGGTEPGNSPPGAPGTARDRRPAPRVGGWALLHLLLVGLAAAVALWRPAALVDRLEGPLVDARFRLRNALRPPAVPRGVVIVAVDEASVSRYGSWPWPAHRVAELIGRVGAAGPKAVGIDLPLDGPAAPAEEARIAGALAALAGKVAIGRTASRADGAGKLRHEALYAREEGVLVPSLALRTAWIAAGLPQEAVWARGAERLEFGGVAVPADSRGRLAVNYYGGEGSLPRYSAGSVLAGETDPAVFAEAAVFLGRTGIAAVDLVGTPFTEDLPVVEKDATVAANLLAADFLREAPPAADLLVLLGAALAVPLLRRRRAALSLPCLLALLVGLAAANLALFSRGLQLALAWPLLVLLGSGGAAVAGQLLAEARTARRVRRMFSSYVTERVVERLIADPAMARPGGERREVTILFADIRGFTGFSERHRPEEVVGTLNEYLEAMTEVVFRWEGTLDKFIGDTILAFWGAPLPQEDHAERALRCALNLCARLDRLNASWATAGRPPFEIGVGVATGTVLVGNIGAEGRKMDYTVIGDEVNVGARVEELTRELGARILITAGTLARLQPALAAATLGHVAIEGLAPVAVRGKREPVRVHRVSPLGHGAATRVVEAAATAAGA